MKNKKMYIVILLVVALALTVTGCGKKAKLKNADEIAVSAKNGNITAEKYYDEIKENNITELIDMIDHNILDKKYKKDKEENEAVEKQINQMKSNYGSNEEQFKSILQQYFGVSTEKELEEMLRLEYKRNKAVKEYISNHLTDKEIKDYYDGNVTGEIKASHILITADVKDNATDEEKEKAESTAKKTAEKVIKELEKGKKFEDLAKKYSKDSATAENGGNLGYFDPSDMVEEFANAVKDLKNGEYTKEPVKTKYGYHIILRVDQKNKKELKEVKDSIKEKLTSQKISENNSTYYESLVKFREEQKVTFKDSTLKKAYDNYMNKLIENAKKSNTSN